MNFNQELITYLDLHDPKSSWYTDKRLFDPGLPLVATYSQRSVPKEGVPILFDLNQIYKYFTCILEYYRRFPVVTGFYVEQGLDYESTFEEFAPSSKRSYEDGYFVNDCLDCMIDRRVPTSKLILRSVDYNLPFRPISRLFFLALGDPDLIRSQFFCYGDADDDWYRVSDFGTPFFPIDNLITTTDVGLMKRMVFFMLKNHNYKNFRNYLIMDEGEVLRDLPFFYDSEQVDNSICFIPENLRLNNNFFEPKTADEGVIAYVMNRRKRPEKFFI